MTTSSKVQSSSYSSFEIQIQASTFDNIQRGDALYTALVKAVNEFWLQHQHNFILRPIGNETTLPSWFRWSFEHNIVRMLSDFRWKMGRNNVKWCPKLYRDACNMVASDAGRSLVDQVASGVGAVEKGNYKILRATMPVYTFQSVLNAVSLMRCQLDDTASSEIIFDENVNWMVAAVTGDCSTMYVVQLFSENN